MADLCQLWLSCKDQKESTRIANSLLAERLIACAKSLPVSSVFWWKGKVGKDREVILIMESRLKHFSKAEAEVKKLHSYNTFVLYATPLLVISKKAGNWVAKEARGT